MAPLRRRAPLRIAVTRDDDGEIERIVPLFVWSTPPLRMLRLLGHGHGDRLGPICADDDARRRRRALRLALAAEPHDVFVGDWVAGDRDWARVPRRPRRSHDGLSHPRSPGRLVARVPRAAEPAVPQERALRPEPPGARTRGELPVRRRRDARARPRRRVPPPRRPLRRASRLPLLRRARGVPARVRRARARARLAAAAAAGDRRSGRSGCEYGFFFQDAYFAYQGGRDPAWDRESVGFLLEVETIRRTLEEGASEYRFLGGEEDYKYRFPAEDPRLETVVVPATARGRARRPR